MVVINNLHFFFTGAGGDIDQLAAKSGKSCKNSSCQISQIGHSSSEAVILGYRFYHLHYKTSPFICHGFPQQRRSAPLQKTQIKRFLFIICFAESIYDHPFILKLISAKAFTCFHFEYDAFRLMFFYNRRLQGINNLVIVSLFKRDHGKQVEGMSLNLQYFRLAVLQWFMPGQFQLQFSPIQFNLVQFGVQFSSVQFSSVQFNSVYFSSIQFSSA